MRFALKKHAQTGRRLSLGVVISLFLCIGCGQKGALYHPTELPSAEDPPAPPHHTRSNESNASPNNGTALEKHDDSEKQGND